MECRLAILDRQDAFSIFRFIDLEHAAVRLKIDGVDAVCKVNAAFLFGILGFCALCLRHGVSCVLFLSSARSEKSGSKQKRR